MIRIDRYDIFCSKGFAFMTVQALAESVANPKSSLTADSATDTSGISSGTPTSYAMQIPSNEVERERPSVKRNFNLTMTRLLGFLFQLAHHSQNHEHNKNCDRPDHSDTNPGTKTIEKRFAASLRLSGSYIGGHFDKRQ